MGIRSASRTAGVHRDTVLNILRFVGGRCEALLKSKLTGIKATHVELDEIWTYVFKKPKEEIDPELDANWYGDYYVFLGLESKTKLLFLPTIGKRTEAKTQEFAANLSRSLADRTQITSDGFRPYVPAIRRAFGGNVDFAQYYKEYTMQKTNVKKDKMHEWQMRHGFKPFTIRTGAPKSFLITTSHVERANLTFRINSKRMNRKTICFSKDEEYLHYATMLFVAHYNFCKTHSSLEKKTTPAMAAGLSLSIWRAEDLVKLC